MGVVLLSRKAKVSFWKVNLKWDIENNYCLKTIVFLSKTVFLVGGKMYLKWVFFLNAIATYLLYYWSNLYP